MSEARFTQQELADLFGPQMPIEAVDALFSASDDKTVGEIRADVRRIAVRTMLGRARVRASTEGEAQADLAAAFAAANIPVEREFRLSSRDRVDFYAWGVAVEVKIGGMSPREILRQLERYAEHDEVKEIILFSSKAMGLPATINGKPASVFSVGRAWL